MRELSLKKFFLCLIQCSYRRVTRLTSNPSDQNALICETNNDKPGWKCCPDKDKWWLIPMGMRSHHLNSNLLYECIFPVGFVISCFYSCHPLSLICTCRWSSDWTIISFCISWSILYLLLMIPYYYTNLQYNIFHFIPFYTIAVMSAKLFGIS